MKIIFIMTALCSLFYLTTHAQDGAKSDFQVRMNQHIALKISDPAFMATAKEIYGHTCEKHHTVTEEEIKARAAEAEKHRFIQANMDEYMRLYFPAQVSSRSITADTFICDNGGFENDFLYLKGYVSTYTNGSNTCTPNVPGWTPVVMPVTNRLEIMAPGLDPLVGIQKVKFGNKSLRINNRYGHNNACQGSGGIDRVTKRFKVTAENRRFTVWYAVALESPSIHPTQQPYLSIKCDKAPADDLCFDAEFLKCAKNYSDPICTYDKIDVVDWACHRFNIPASEIGNIATIEMVVGDCAQIEHFGYAYIDGFCEECTGSSLGSIHLNGSELDPNLGGIQYYSCDGQTARVCGSYTLPTLCGGWSINNITVPGYSIQNLVIDQVNQTFCFDFPLSNFGSNTCLEINASITFNSSLGMNLPAQTSNFIKICKNLYKSYGYSFSVGACHDNLSSSLLSDDYYYVTVTINDANNNGWSIQRQLSDPYPGESGHYTITSGSGDDVVILGPFLIQEGCWDIIVSLPNCTYTDKICPPNYCSGCTAFAGLEISNVTCIPSTTVGVPDTWTFDIFVPGTGTYTINGVAKSKGATYTINGGNINQSCFNVTLASGICESTLIICPPVPCSVSNCDIEVYPGKITCSKDGYIITLNTINTNLCYDVIGDSNPAVNVPANGDIGPFTGSVQVIISVCNNPDCYKMLYLPKPNCNDPNLELSQGRTKAPINQLNLRIVPNPFTNNQITIKSDLKVEQDVEFLIYNNAGQLIQYGQYIGQEQTIPFDQPSGMYIIKFKNEIGHEQYCKFVKM
ncbi:MAG: T9SS type A sorting domain-containing protein [Saprospiraceae bacterium]